MIKSILGATLGLQATGLMGMTAKTASDSFTMKPSKSGKAIMKNMVGTTIGVGLLGAQSQMVNAL